MILDGLKSRIWVCDLWLHTTCKGNAPLHGWSRCRIMLSAIDVPSWQEMRPAQPKLVSPLKYFMSHTIKISNHNFQSKPALTRSSLVSVAKGIQLWSWLLAHVAFINRSRVYLSAHVRPSHILFFSIIAGTRLLALFMNLALRACVCNYKNSELNKQINGQIDWFGCPGTVLNTINVMNLYYRSYSSLTNTTTFSYLERKEINTFFNSKSTLSINPGPAMIEIYS